tara:strand:+ start:112 stop:261 length:150 start_codon:yes stop_codon:yes gene_type:complete
MHSVFYDEISIAPMNGRLTRKKENRVYPEKQCNCVGKMVSRAGIEPATR